MFPHHENELAQSAALGRPMANIWAHNGFVNINNEKMSKSLGNTFNVKDIFKCFPPEVLRFFLISSHYRGPIDFSDEALKEASRALERIYRTLEAADSFLVIKGFSLTNPPKALELQEYTELSQKFSAAMDDDLNTSKALGHLFELVHLINRLVTENEASKVYFLRQLLWAMGEELGLRFKEPKVFLGLLEGIKLEGKESLKVSLIEEKVAQRNEARSNKDWAKADLLRKELSEMGVTLEDRGGATSWRFT